MAENVRTSNGRHQLVINSIVSSFSCKITVESAVSQAIVTSPGTLLVVAVVPVMRVLHILPVTTVRTQSAGQVVRLT